MKIEIDKPTSMAKRINLPDMYFKQIMSAVGGPLIQISDTEWGNDIDSFKELVVEPALETYFTYFPLIYSKDYKISNSNFSIDFPDKDVPDIIYSALAKINSYTPLTTGSRLYNNVFVNAQYISPTNMMSLGIGSRNDYGFLGAIMSKESETTSRVNHYKSFRYDVDMVNRKVNGYANIVGTMIVDYLSYSLDVEKVKFFHMQDFIKLCKANLLKILGFIRGQEKTDGMDFNYDLFISTSDNYTKEVLDKWQHSVYDPVVVRL